MSEEQCCKVSVERTQLLQTRLASGNVRSVCAKLLLQRKLLQGKVTKRRTRRSKGKMHFLSILFLVVTLPYSSLLLSSSFASTILTVPRASKGEKQGLQHSSCTYCRSRSLTTAGAFEKTHETHMHQLARHLKSLRIALKAGACQLRASSQKISSQKPLLLFAQLAITYVLPYVLPYSRNLP